MLRFLDHTWKRIELNYGLPRSFLCVKSQNRSSNQRLPNEDKLGRRVV